jgi:putative Ca2+/H+ antiporter (TMEM165/GDT1 family)
MRSPSPSASILGTRMPERAIKIFASVAFVVFGVILIAEALRLF